MRDANCQLFKSKLAEAVYQKFMDLDEGVDEIELNLNGKRNMKLQGNCNMTMMKIILRTITKNLED